MHTICESLSKEYIDTKENHGIMIGILDNDTTYTFSFGVMQKGDTSTINEHHIFQLASVTKVFTGMMCAMAESDSLIKLHEDINTYLPDGFKVQTPYMILVQDLITHHSGLPKMPDNYQFYNRESDNPFKFYNNNHLREYLSKPIIGDAKKNFQYSNLNYYILGLILQQVYDDNIEQILLQKLLKELDLRETFLYLPSSMIRKVAIPHKFDGKETPLYQFAGMQASSALHSSMHDLLLILKSLQKPNTYINKIFELACVDLGDTNVKNVHYGYGWQLYYIQKNKAPILTHNGTTDGHRSYIAYNKTLNQGVIILSNSANSPDQIGINIMEVLENSIKK